MQSRRVLEQAFILLTFTQVHTPPATDEKVSRLHEQCTLGLVTSQISVQPFITLQSWMIKTILL